MRRAAIAFALISATTAPAQADPISIAILGALGYTGAAGLLAPTAILLSIAGNAFVAALPGLLLTAGLALGASVVSDLFRQRSAAPMPSDRQQTVRQSVGPRLKFYGRNKIGGTLSFFESKNGVLYSQIIHNQGQIFQILEHWLVDTQVTRNLDNFVVQPPWNGTAAGDSLVRIEHRMGLDDSLAYDNLVATFPEIYTSDHRLRGLTTTLISYFEVAAEYIADTYPQGAPAFRMVADCSLVYRARQGDFGYSDNPSDCIYDYLIHPDGANKPASLIDTQSFHNFANVCDEPILTKTGATIRRYSLATSYALNEQERDVLDRMLITCDAELYITSQGKIAIRGGKWIEPTVTLDATAGHIMGGEWSRGRGRLASFNKLTIIYTEPLQDYSEVEGQTWVDVENVALRGHVLSQQVSLTGVSVHAQARRLAKIMTKKANPRWVGTITTNMYGFNAIGEQNINIVFPELGINESFSITSLKFLDDMTGVQIGVASLSEEAYDWDPSLEDGTGPSDAVDTTAPVDLSPPANIRATTIERIINESVVGNVLVVLWDPVDRPALSQQVQYRENPSGAWFDMQVFSEDERAESGIVNEGGVYDIQVRTLSPAGALGPWSDIITVTAFAIVTSDTTLVTSDSTTIRSDTM